MLLEAVKTQNVEGKGEKGRLITLLLTFETISAKGWLCFRSVVIYIYMALCTFIILTKLTNFNELSIDKLVSLLCVNKIVKIRRIQTYIKLFVLLSFIMTKNNLVVTDLLILVARGRYLLSPPLLLLPHDDIFGAIAKLW